MSKLPKYIPHKDREERILSAKSAAKAIAKLDLYLSHKKELLSVCIWKITEVDGFYKERYISIGGLNTNDRKSLQHEHVFQRATLIKEILEEPDKVDEILDKAIGCAVTKEEHELLTAASREDPSLEGWERYKKAGIKVFDLIKQSEHKI